MSVKEQIILGTDRRNKENPACYTILNIALKTGVYEITRHSRLATELAPLFSIDIFTLPCTNTVMT